MQLILFFLIGYISGVISLKIIKYNSYSIVFQFFDKGKKVDTKILSEVEKILSEKEKTSKIKKIGTFILVLPIINIMYAYLEGFMIRRDIRKYLERNNGLYDMTEEEIKEYKSLKDVDSKLSYVTLISHRKKASKLNISKGRLIINDKQLLRLKCERLTPLAYTLNDVKTLNDCTTGEYIVGKVRDCNVAVVGCKETTDYNSMVFSSLDKNHIYEYKTFTEEEAQDKTFIVYPYDEEVESEVQRGIISIMKNRLKKESERSYSNQIIEKPKILSHTIIKN